MSDMALPEMFSCPRTAMRLTPAGCARLWTAANDPDHNAKNGNNRRHKSYRPEPWEGKAACWHCPIGAKHAGADFNSRPLSDIMRNRCGATGAVASRLVAGYAGTFDVSVYNRRCEALRGRNARGSRPRICNRLHHITLAVIDESAVTIKEFGPLLSPLEALLNAARTATGATIAIGRPGVRVVIPDDNREDAQEAAA